MFFHSQQEQQPANEKKIKELGIKLERVIEEIDEFLKQYGVDLEAIHGHYNSEENFSREEWAALQEAKKENAARLEALKNAVLDPRTTEKKYAERREIDPRWLYVR